MRVKKRSNEKIVQCTDNTLPEVVRPKCWQTFFMSQPNPILRSQLLTSLLSGTVLTIDRLPTVVLQDVVLLAMGARAYFNAEIVDDYTALLDRTREVWRAPDFTHRIMDQTHGLWVSAVVDRAAAEFMNAEEQYIPAMVEWYLNHEPPEYFARELKDGEVMQPRAEEVTHDHGKRADQASTKVSTRNNGSTGTLRVPRRRASVDGDKSARNIHDGAVEQRPSIGNKTNVGAAKKKTARRAK